MIVKTDYLSVFFFYVIISVVVNECRAGRIKMLEKIISTIIGVVVTSAVTGVIGYLTGKMKGYKTRDTIQEEALKCLLRSNITSKYYVYSELREIPYYEKENVDRMFEQYKNMGGNSYVETIVREINQLPTKK